MAEIYINRGPQVLDVLPFIPKTKANNEYVQTIIDLKNMDNLDRWFLNHMQVGGRNNTLHNYAKMLMDAGADYDTIEKKVVKLNQDSGSPLKKDEVYSTVLKSVASKMSK